MFFGLFLMCFLSFFGFSFVYAFAINVLDINRSNYLL